jgi:hypothetical protein
VTQPFAFFAKAGRARVGRTLLSAAVAVVLWTVRTTPTEGVPHLCDSVRKGGRQIADSGNVPPVSLRLSGSFTSPPKQDHPLPIVISSAAGSSANADHPAESRNLLIRSRQPNKIDV